MLTIATTKIYLSFIIHVENNSPLVFEIIDDGTVFDINEFTTPAMDNIVHEKRKGGLAYDWSNRSWIK